MVYIVFEFYEFRGCYNNFASAEAERIRQEYRDMDADKGHSGLEEYIKVSAITPKD